MLMNKNEKPRDYIISKLEQKYPQMNCRTTEEFDGHSGGIWISAEGKETYYSINGQIVQSTIVVLCTI